eukprot:gene8267-11190_t
MTVQHYLIAARFFTTMGHLVALLVLFGTIDSNIEASIGDNDASGKKIAIQTSWSALIFGFLCFLFDFGGIFLGTSLFNNSVNLFQILFHFIGSIFLSWLITNNWHYKALWPIIVSCNLPTALCEIMVILSVTVFRVISY